jgi:hypothetical protein
MLEFGEEQTSVEVRLLPGDGLLLYTDGFTEARDARGAFFPLARHAASAEPAELMRCLVGDLAAHAGDRLGDDAALVLLRRRELEEADVAAPALPPARRSQHDISRHRKRHDERPRG